ncbi:hypothetical protein [Bartonella bovis]|uniref:hypothetical protein n=1 Tax=Bartonella bovis TaxID=155194 RepID=UPI0003A6AED9|nr:hypothetical protein [Bartonella bovis]
MHFAQEHPQVVSYIVARLPSEIAAKILMAQPMVVRANLTVKGCIYAQSHQQ